jgi:hypothetical protein
MSSGFVFDIVYLPSADRPALNRGSLRSHRTAPRPLHWLGAMAHVLVSAERPTRELFAWLGVDGDVASKQCLEQYYSTILFLGSNGGGKLVSPSMSRKSISAVRHICEIRTSFALPPNGFSVLSPTRSSEVYIQEINTLKGRPARPCFP